MAACVLGRLAVTVAHGTKRIPCLNILSSLSRTTTKRSLSSLVSDKITVNGADLHYEKAGEGPQVVLCIPGALGSTQSDFGPQLTGLSDEFTVIAMDPRGYGKSRPPERDFPLDFYERDAWDAAELMRKLGYPRYSLLGWSDGGISGISLAANNPRAVDKLVVWGANSFITQDDLDLFERTRDVDKWNPRMREPLEAIYGVNGLRSTWEGWLDCIQMMYKEKSGEINQHLLPKIKCPTLIIHGEKDPMLTPVHPEYMLKHIPGSVLHMWPGGRHNIHLRYPKEFNDIVRQFLKE